MRLLSSTINYNNIYDCPSINDLWHITQGALSPVCILNVFTLEAISDLPGEHFLLQNCGHCSSVPVKRLIFATYGRIKLIDALDNRFSIQTANKNMGNFIMNNLPFKCVLMFLTDVSSHM